MSNDKKKAEARQRQLLSQVKRQGHILVNDQGGVGESRDLKALAQSGKLRTGAMNKIYLKGIYSGNPFELHPVLRQIWDNARSAHAERDTVADLALGVNADPHRNRVFLILEPSGEVAGITGFFQPTVDETVLGLRWHGIVPEGRGLGYSETSIDEVCSMAACYHPMASEIVEYVPFADERKGRQLATYFTRLGFAADPAPKDASLLPAGLSLPAGSGDWLAMRRPLTSEHAALFA